MEQVDDKSFLRMRRSACADASLLAEIERLKKMKPLERANAALGMGKIFKKANHAHQNSRRIMADNQIIPVKNIESECGKW